MEEMVHTCPKCGEPKPIERFREVGRRKPYECLDCYAARVRAYRSTHRESTRAYNRIWMRMHRAMRRALMRGTKYRIEDELICEGKSYEEYLKDQEQRNRGRLTKRP